MEPSLPNPQPFDGLRPKNALCTSCGFHFGGIPIHGGQITCPECGTPVAFALVPPRRPTGRRMWFLLMVFVMGGAAVGMAGLVGGGRAGAVVCAIVLVFWILLRLLRRMIER